MKLLSNHLKVVLYRDMGNHLPGRLSLLCVDQGIEISCDRESTLSILKANFGAMLGPAPDHHLRYEVRTDADGVMRLSRRGSSFRVDAEDIGELISLLEGDLVVQLQLLRPDYLFIHAAVLAFDQAAHLLVGRSGAGKSTTCWGLLHHGFRYVSDELAPVSLETQTILSYSHALCMKSEPPSSYPLPDGSKETSRGFHVPVCRMPLVSWDERLRLRSVFLMEYAPTRDRPTLRSVGAAEAATRLYPHILNALAHEDDGLKAASDLAKSARCFQLEAASLQETCLAILETVKGH